MIENWLQMTADQQHCVETFFKDIKMSGLEQTLKERGQTHGDYTLQATVAQRLKSDMADTPNWEKLNCAQRESLEMFATKISRILVGNANHKDNWHDIAGYAKLIEDRL
jgi:hypothetical protein